MNRCARCGSEIDQSGVCKACGYAGESKSVLDKGVKTIKTATGKAIETGINVSERVAKKAKPMVDAVVSDTRKSVKKAKEKTLSAAKRLQA